MDNLRVTAALLDFLIPFLFALASVSAVTVVWLAFKHRKKETPMSDPSSILPYKPGTWYRCVRARRHVNGWEIFPDVLTALRGLGIDLEAQP